MRLVALFVTVNFLIGLVSLVRIFQYVNLYRELGKKIEKFDSRLYLQRYCDPTFKSFMSSPALFNEIVHPEEIPEGIKDQFGADFAIARKNFFSAAWWLGGSFAFAVFVQILFRP